MVPKKFTIVGLGEVLWDLFSKGKELGGAPTNFAYMTSLLGDTGVVASRVGKDQLGNSAARRLTRLGLSNTYLQKDSYHPTGVVQVEVDGSGQPKFEIAKEVAWDFFEWTTQWQELAAQTDAVCFGSLAQRSGQTRATIRKFLAAVPPRTVRVFDVNLRQNFYSEEVIAESAALTDVMKLNEDELPTVAKLVGYTGVDDDEQAQAKFLLKTFPVKLICATRGAKGSLLVSADGMHDHPGFTVRVADAVGSGDAFTAGLLHHYLRGASLAEMNAAANRMGSWVASKVGATPRADVVMLEEMRREDYEE